MRKLKLAVFLCGVALVTMGAGGSQRLPPTYVENFAGSDFGAQINACLAAAPSRGVCDATSAGISRSQSAAATIAVPTLKTLILGDVQITCNATPCMTVGSYSRVFGSPLTYLKVGISGGIGIQNVNTTVAANFIELHNMIIFAQNTNVIDLDLTKISFSNFDHMQLISDKAGLLSYAGSVGVNLDGGGACTCFDVFINPTISNMATGMLFANAANSNQIFGGEITRATYGIELAGVNGNSIYGTDFEANTSASILIDVTAGANSIFGTRHEELVANGATAYIINNSTFRQFAVGLNNGGNTAAYTDNTGTLIYSDTLGKDKAAVRTIAQTLAITCNAAAESNRAYIKDTVGLIAPAPGGAVAGGGATAVHNYAWCNGTSWLYE